MSNAQHTPGPWSVDENVNGIHIMQDNPGSVDLKVARIAGRADDSIANAWLIAAAPDLLDACQAMIRWDDAEKNARPFDEDFGKGFYDRMDMCAEAFAKAREAITKAQAMSTGEKHD